MRERSLRLSRNRENCDPMNSLLMTAQNGQKVYDRVKTQTRRILNPQPSRVDESGRWYRMPGGGDSLNCYDIPYRVGERRYIREPHYLYGRWKREGKTKTGKPKYRFIADRSKGACYPNNPPPRVCTRKSAVGWFRRPGMFMFEWAARTIVEITEVRIQRVQEISEEDAKAEGCAIPAVMYADAPQDTYLYVPKFKALWDSEDIHGAGAWERNDWVAAVTMRRVGR